jgi:hypothetical protein
MRRFFTATLFIACAATFAHAQGGGDYNRYDVYVGYSHNRVDTGGDGREGFNGVEGAVTGNFSRYVGLKGSYSFQRKSFDVGIVVDCVNTPTCPGSVLTTENFDLHTLVGGVEFKDNAKESKIKPFAHLLAGFAHSRLHVVNPPTGFSGDSSDTGFSAVIGGGLNFRVSSRFDIRAVQLDYNPTRFGGETQHNFRVGVGVVFR